jgi:hypothetical protein
MKWSAPPPVHTMTQRKYDGMFFGTSRFSFGIRRALERAVARSLLGHTSTRIPLQAAVRGAALELGVQGLDLAAMTAFLCSVVEDAGRVCGADRPSLVSREPRWVAVRDQVIEALTNGPVGALAPAA